MFSLADSSDVRLVCYNNFGDDYGQFYPQDDPFRDTLMDRMPREVRVGWSKMMQSSRYRISTERADPGDAKQSGALPSSNGAGGLIFNGKDLAGWTTNFKDGDAQAEDEFDVTSKGILSLRARHEGYLKTEKPYQDFVLTFDWRFPRGGKQSGSGSGVLLGLGERGRLALARVRGPDRLSELRGPLGLRRLPFRRPGHRGSIRAGARRRWGREADRRMELLRDPVRGSEDHDHAERQGRQRGDAATERSPAGSG